MARRADAVTDVGATVCWPVGVKLPARSSRRRLRAAAERVIVRQTVKMRIAHRNESARAIATLSAGFADGDQ
jgi:hypothetical protein